MAGNVREWTADWFQKDYYCDGIDSTGDIDCAECGEWPDFPEAWQEPFCDIEAQGKYKYKVQRGGGYVFANGSGRVSSRYAGSITEPVVDAGFRCCKTECTPDCEGMECGDDGCGGSCGGCDADYGCNPDGQCEYVPWCGDGKCDASEDCAECPGDCGDCCPNGICDSGETYVTCPQDCGDACESGVSSGVTTEGEHGVVWVEIPTGCYAMGCSPGDSDCADIEKPAHEVFVYSFEVMEAEVTEGQYQAVIGGWIPSCDENGGGGSNSPVECVDWYEAEAFCKAIDPPHSRLCTEAEWEYAARAGTTSKYYCGNNDGCLFENAWYDGNSNDGPGFHKHDVKGRAPNDYGLYDILGNVEEWVEDCSHWPSYDLDDDGEADWNLGFPAWATDCTGSGRVYRGGGYGIGGSFNKEYRVSHRASATPSLTNAERGFRCCRTYCELECNGKECGGDGCGGTCGDCDEHYLCTDEGKCEYVPWCGDGNCDDEEYCVLCPEDCGECPEQCESGTSSGVKKGGQNGVVWVEIPGGCFVMGCSWWDSSCPDDELPRHIVEMSPFEILETEVTEGQYSAVVGGDPSCDFNGGGGANSPVECLTWEEASAFCEAVDDGGRLCTEAEWEYAARAGAATTYGCGNDKICLDPFAWHAGNSDDGPGVHKRDVKGRAPNLFGLYDMHGNLSEFVEDCWHSDYDLDDDGEGDWGGGFPAWTTDCSYPQHRVFRGDSFKISAYAHKLSSRGVLQESDFIDTVGLRCCRPVCAPDCCGNGFCDNGETCETCEADCEACPGQCDPSCDPELEESVQTTTGGWVCAAKMVTIPAGNFWMGCNDSADPSCACPVGTNDDECPYHQVTTPEYQIDFTEVTNAQYVEYLNVHGNTYSYNQVEHQCIDGDSEFIQIKKDGEEWSVEGASDNYPVVDVTWFGARAYCEWRCPTCRLCSEAEWEKAARGGCEKYVDCAAESVIYPWGNNYPSSCDGMTAVYSGCNCDGGPCEVGKHEAGQSPYSVHDMAGNVWEWVEDWYHDSYVGAPPNGSAWVSPTTSNRVYRGGSFSSDSNYSNSFRISLRYSFFFYPLYSNNNLGFRCCNSPDE